MANWAWPHTPTSIAARLLLAGGPFDGEQAAFLPPGTAAPAQIVWSGWLPWGFAAYLYEWHGETTMDRGRTDALVYRFAGRRLAAAEIPPLLADDVEVWADGAQLMVLMTGRRPDELWPGI